MKNNYFLKRYERSIFICCGKAGCPSVYGGDDGMIHIKDDFGNDVKMKPEEAELISRAVEGITNPADGSVSTLSEDISEGRTSDPTESE